MTKFFGKNSNFFYGNLQKIIENEFLEMSLSFMDAGGGIDAGSAEVFGAAVNAFFAARSMDMDTAFFW